MAELNAIKISRDLLEQPLSGKVHSVFKRSLNVLTDKGFFYTICTPEIYDGPNQIKLLTEDFAKADFQVGDLIVEKDNQLVIGDQSIKLEFISIFPIQQTIYPILPSPVSHQLLIDLNHWLIETSDTVGYYRQSFPNTIENVMHDMLLSGCDLLIDGLKNEDAKLIEKGISSLIGLGHGLTPSGDDILTGFSLILNSQGNPWSTKQKLFNGFLEQVLKETNLISQNQLLTSMVGKSLHPVVDFINDLPKISNIEELKKASEVFFTIGSSSGRDILSGIIQSVLLLNQEDLKALN